jgi:hypothetical protein
MDGCLSLSKPGENVALRNQLCYTTVHDILTLYCTTAFTYSVNKKDEENDRDKKRTYFRS